MSDFDHTLFRQNITLRCPCVAQEQLDPDCEYHGKESRMSEKYYVVSESELKASWEANWNGREERNDRDEANWKDTPSAVELTEAACRAREVTLYERCQDDNEKPVGNIWLEEIKK